jgi:uncharacterized membrane protein (DUF485 family)
MLAEPVLTMATGHTTPTPPAPEWDRLADDPGFRRLLRGKRRFIVPATVFFLLYYFALPLLTGYFPEFMSRKAFGHLSFAYVFALSQFPMAWILSAMYLRAAARFDHAAAEVLNAGPAAGEDSAA